MPEPRFNLRVYGLLINDHHEVLLCDEERGRHQFTKFPGGGVNHGEGIKDALLRECREELQSEAEVLSHFYTTDFYQPSAFDGSQVISVYYRIKIIGKAGFEVSEAPFQFTQLLPNEKLGFRWHPVASLAEGVLTFPIDRHVAAMLKEEL